MDSPNINDSEGNTSGSIGWLAPLLQFYVSAIEADYAKKKKKKKIVTLLIQVFLGLGMALWLISQK